MVEFCLDRTGPQESPLGRKMQARLHPLRTLIMSPAAGESCRRVLVSASGVSAAPFIPNIDEQTAEAVLIWPV